jgi:hypothetical protein
MTSGSGTFLKRVNTSQVATAMITVVTSMMARRPRTKAAPAMAPVAAAVTPSTKRAPRVVGEASEVGRGMMTKR